METIHRSAAAGYAAQADTYVSGRPDYPPALDGWLRGDLRLGPGRTVLDLGAGTGKFTPRLTETGARVVAAEPVAAMRARLVQCNPGVEAHPGHAEAIPLADGAVDAVVCAQSFHWFATAAALAEIRRVLRPGGTLGLVWNVRDESVPWVADLTRIVDAYEDDTPRYRTGAWRAAFPAAGFGPLHERRLPHHHEGPAEDVVVGRALSVSFIAALPTDERAAVAAAVRALIAATPELAGRDSVRYPYETVAFHCTAADRPAAA
ncbi:class I SAM-dependent methyltransferase [Methylobacterium sp. WL8]|uniref:class I SAM-dependent methyltransferase n=1 Tax=Methylobacterium sp. WL8 TaxID=2603899 RepID=UPI0011C7646F|nr:class I SAM-dependent methyltransferase [Methylobacterium sp. WL8]TXN84901.1 class I SAM-dependent methyltransferase [Methylobacterium sp. WL8]